MNTHLIVIWGKNRCLYKTFLGDDTVLGMSSMPVITNATSSPPPLFFLA
jgi:hypothetical protein